MNNYFKINKETITNIIFVIKVFFVWLIATKVIKYFWVHNMGKIQDEIFSLSNMDYYGITLIIVFLGLCVWVVVELIALILLYIIGLSKKLPKLNVRIPIYKKDIEKFEKKHPRKVKFGEKEDNFRYCERIIKKKIIGGK